MNIYTMGIQKLFTNRFEIIWHVINFYDHLFKCKILRNNISAKERSIVKLGFLATENSYQDLNSVLKFSNPCWQKISRIHVMQFTVWNIMLWSVREKATTICVFAHKQLRSDWSQELRLHLPKRVSNYSFKWLQSLTAECRMLANCHYTLLNLVITENRWLNSVNYNKASFKTNEI